MHRQFWYFLFWLMLVYHLKLSYSVSFSCMTFFWGARGTHRLPNIMKAKKKPIVNYSAADLGIDTTPRLEVLKVEEPPKRKGGLKVANVDEVISKLKEAGALWDRLLLYDLYQLLLSNPIYFIFSSETMMGCEYIPGSFSPLHHSTSLFFGWVYKFWSKWSLSFRVYIYIYVCVCISLTWPQYLIGSIISRK